MGMEILKGLNVRVKNSAVSLGKFDGVHRGHRLLLQEILKRKDLIPTVFTFGISSETGECISKSGTPVIPGRQIYSQQEKDIILQGMGIKREILFPFTPETRTISPAEFIEHILIEHLDAKLICVGEDFRFGRDRVGNVALLKEYAPKYGYELKIYPKLMAGDEVISSTRVRTLLTQGELDQANELLGGIYFVQGEVIHGNALGRTMNMPTANIFPAPEKVLLPSGVYATTVILDGQAYHAVTNVGRKPTVGSDRIGIESCLLDFDADIYGEEIQVQFLRFLRPEKKFSDLKALQQQMERDKEHARQELKRYFR